MKLRSVISGGPKLCRDGRSVAVELTYADFCSGFAGLYYDIENGTWSALPLVDGGMLEEHLSSMTLVSEVGMDVLRSFAVDSKEKGPLLFLNSPAGDLEKLELVPDNVQRILWKLVLELGQILRAIGIVIPLTDPRGGYGVYSLPLELAKYRS